MFQTLKNAWKIPDLRRKMLYTLLMLVIFRFGSFIPVPGLDASALKSMVGENNNLFGILDLFSGGAFSNATIFAMSITPYINSSIIMQLLTVAIPALERLSKEGEEGRKKINDITRYVAVALAFVQATGLYFGLNNAVEHKNVWGFLILTLTFTAGTAFLMWLGEEITQRGIGNGISMLIFAGIVARIPNMAQSAWNNFGIEKWYMLVVILVYMIAAIAFVIYVTNAERRISVQYAKRVVGRKMYGGQSSNIPIKVASAGVIPIIFAMSIMSFPGTLAQFWNPTAGTFWAGFVNFFSLSNPFYAVIYFLLIIGFTYFYTSITFNPIEIANNMKRNGGFIPGIRPGKPTSDFISKILSRITIVGAIFLAIVAVVPIVASYFIPGFQSLSLGGTSLLIVVGVALETVQQLESQMLMRHYKGFLE